MRPRDNQRKKVYTAEDKTLMWGWGMMTDITDVKHYVDKVLKSRYVRDRWGLFEPVVKDGRGRRKASGSKRALKFPRHTRFPVLILHEIAHALTPACYAAHGTEFCSNYLELVRKFMGTEHALDLEKQFRAHRVSYNRCLIYTSEGVRDTFEKSFTNDCLTMTS